MRNYSVLFAALIFGVIVGFAGFVVNTPGGLTGYVTAEPTTETVTAGSVFSTSTNYTLNTTDISGVKLSGTLSDGSGRVDLVTESGTFLVWTGETTVETYTIVTDKESYARNSNILVTVTPESEYTLWLANEAGDKTVVQDSFVVEVPGYYIVDALINDSGNITKVSTEFVVRNDTNSSNDIVRVLETPTLVFVDECIDSCEIEQASSGTLVITVSDGATLDISEVIVLTPRENNAPEQTVALPNIALSVGESTIINLDTHFTDADGDTLTYDFMNAAGVNMDLVDNLLTVTGTAAGSTQSIVYASDLYELIESNLFAITVSDDVNVINTTPLNLTNTTNTTHPSNFTNYPANYTNNTALNCTNSDPNLRPVECLQQDHALNFPEQTIYLTTTSREPSARITTIGNLLIKGDVQERVSFVARSTDYRIGYEDAYGQFITTVWVDSVTGNLNLKGNLYEESSAMEPQPGNFVLRNKKGITLAWANTQTGDFYLRGNLIPYRRSLE